LSLVLLNRVLVKNRRLFIALPVDDRALIKPLGSIYSDLNKYSSILKSVSIENLHITMKFLGDVDEDKMLKMADLFSSLENPGSIEYTIKGAGCFPSLSAPSVIWAGIQCDMGIMSKLYSLVEDFCESFGFERETRRFIPHLTVARVRRGKDIPPGLKEFIKSNKERVYGTSVFNRLVLFESKLDKTGPEYISLAEVRLA